MLAMGATIAPEDLGDDGVETEPHVTVRYGLHDSDPAGVRPIVANHPPIAGKLGRVGCFYGAESGKPYDVLFVGVDSPGLHRLNAALATLPHTDTHPGYKPHATLAYVKAGLGAKYRTAMGGVSESFVAPSVEFSNPDKQKETIPLRSGVAKFADIPHDEVALAGKDGAQAAKLLGKAKDAGVKTLYWLTRRAVQRLLEHPDPQAAKHLFDDSELIALADQLAATNATANLLGRARIREKADHAGKVEFADDSFVAFVEPPPPLPPTQAINYFQGLVPTIGVDPQRFGPLLRREAFTLAGQTDTAILDRVKSTILDSLQTGKGTGVTPDVESILTQAGVSPANPQYSEMVVRTNLMDSFNVGAQQELQTSDMQDAFPVWCYLGIEDGRQRPAHQVQFNKYFPNTASFAEIRDAVKGEFDGYNCRCSFRAIDKYEWAKLQAAGAQVETSW